MLKVCPKCKCEGIWQSGFIKVNGEKRKRYKCKSCEYQFSKEKTKEYSLELKLKAMEMLKEGIGFRSIGRLLGVSFEIVRKWAKQMAGRIFGANIKEEIIDAVQIDEMCIQIKKSAIKDGYGLLMMEQEGKYWTFKLEIEAQKNLINYLQELKQDIKSKNTTPITTLYIKS
jgi:transposase